MGQSPVPPVNIPIPTKIGSKMGGATAPKWDFLGFNHGHMTLSLIHWSPGNRSRLRGVRGAQNLLKALPGDLRSRLLSARSDADAVKQVRARSPGGEAKELRLEQVSVVQ